MATENASYISEFNAAYPADGDAVGEGGGTTTGTGSTRGHLNMIKYVLKTQFSGLSGTTAITPSEAELNYVDGVTSAIQTQIDTKGVGDAVKADDASWTGSQRATLLVDNDGSFDMNGAQNFKCTPAGDVELTFTNFANGQSGYVILVNSGGHAISRHGDTIADANFVSTVSAAGTYIISYISDGADAFLTNSAIMA